MSGTVVLGGAIAGTTGADLTGLQGQDIQVVGVPAERQKDLVDLIERVERGEGTTGPQGTARLLSAQGVPLPGPTVDLPVGPSGEPVAPSVGGPSQQVPDTAAPGDSNEVSPGPTSPGEPDEGPRPDDTEPAEPVAPVNPGETPAGDNTDLPAGTSEGVEEVGGEGEQIVPSDSTEQPASDQDVIQPD